MSKPKGGKGNHGRGGSKTPELLAKELLADQRRIEAYSLKTKGWTLIKIAKLYGVTEKTISLDLKRRREELREAGLAVNADDREDHIKRLLGHATADLGTYMDVQALEPDRRSLMGLFDELDDDEELFNRLRGQLLKINLKDWSDLTATERRSIKSVKTSKDGQIEFVLEPKAQYEKLLQEVHGWGSSRLLIESDVADLMVKLVEGFRSWCEKEGHKEWSDAFSRFCLEGEEKE